MRRMIALLLLLAAATLLVLGYLNEQPALVWVALGLSCLVVLLVLGPRLVPSRKSASAESDTFEHGEPTEQPQPPEEASEAEPAPVVFAPGKLTFHRASCGELGDVPTSAAARHQLEAGGMKACPHCLPPTG